MRGRRLTPLGWVVLIGLPVLAGITLLAPTAVVVVAWVLVALVVLGSFAGGSPSARAGPRSNPFGSFGREDPAAQAAREYQRRHGIR